MADSSLATEVELIDALMPCNADDLWDHTDEDFASGEE